MRYDRWTVLHRNYIIIHSAIMDMTEDIPYDYRPVRHLSVVIHHAENINSQFNRFIFLSRSRSHVR